jgi:2-iminoacetate synthase
MQLAKSGQIKNVCQPNALSTLAEYLIDYGDDDLKTRGFALIDREIALIERPDIRDFALKAQTDIRQGKRDIFL